MSLTSTEPTPPMAYQVVVRKRSTQVIWSQMGTYPTRAEADVARATMKQNHSHWQVVIVQVPGLAPGEGI